MGRTSSLCNLFSCFAPPSTNDRHHHQQPPDLAFQETEPLDETLGHSFCYVRSSNRFLSSPTHSPSHSDRFLTSPSASLRFSPTHTEPVFKSISGASVSANSSAPKTVLQFDADAAAGFPPRGSIVNGFEATSSFSALPLQPAPRGNGEPSGRAFFLSGPIESGAMSGPLDAAAAAEGGGPASAAGVPFSAPLGGLYGKKKRKKGIPGLRKAFHRRSLSEMKRPWVVPVLNFVGRKEDPPEIEGGSGAAAAEAGKGESNVQWALGKAGEDRVHVVVSEEQGWLFVGIYDGFNGPDAPEFLMGHLYRAVHSELQGLFWEVEEETAVETNPSSEPASAHAAESSMAVEEDSKDDGGSAKRVTFQVEGTESRRRRLWELLAEDAAEDGLDLSGSDRFAFSVDDALSVSKEGSSGSRRWMVLSKLKHGLSKHKEGRGGKLLPWSLATEDKEKVEVEARAEEKSHGGEGTGTGNGNGGGRRRKVGPVNHDLVLRALSRALEMTELAYLDMTDKVIDTNPELALMGSCLLVALMRGEDVYVMNVGDSRAIVAQYEHIEVGCSKGSGSNGDVGSGTESITVESSLCQGERAIRSGKEGPAQEMRLVALQLSTDHSTSVEEEIIRIKNEHPDDSHCIVNDRVKGRLKVTRAFGAGFLKQPKFNDAVLEMFRNEYIGTAPYVSCCPSLRHHRLCPRDQFLILSSDGLYQYLSNQEVVSQVESFMEKFPDGDPAQHLIEELLVRAAKKAGMDFHELLDIPQGDRRKYHDDVTVMVISLEGRIWKSSGKYL